MSDRQAEPPTDESNASNESTGGFLDRRDYLRYTGALAGAPLAANHGTRIASADDGDDVGPITPTNLRVEYAREPNNVLPTAGSSDQPLEAPRFTWAVTGHRGVTQSAYRILVTESRDAIDADDGLVWDSGKVESADSINVPYDGEALEPDTTYHWTVRIWDGDGNESGWSDPATFTTAIPHTDEHWEGEWIGPEYEGSELPGSEWTDYTLEVEFTLVANAAGFVFRATDSDNFYMWQVNTVEEPYPVLRPHVREGGEWEVLDQIDIDDAFDGEGEVHTLTIDVDGDDVTTYLDGTQVDARSDPIHDAGTIGFRTDLGEHAAVNSVKVTDSGGEVRFEDDFDSPEENFDGGTVEDGTLDLDGAGVVLRSAGYDRPAPLLRREFDLEKEVERARVHVSGLGYYELYCNGERVGDRVLEPGQTDYEETILYSTYDVTDRLQDGANAIGAALGRGRIGELVDNAWAWEDTPWWTDPQLLVQLNVEFADGTSTSIVTDESWTMTDGPTRFDSLYGGEVYDARLEKTGWTAPGYDDTDWEQATEVDSLGGEYVPQHVQPIEVADTLEAVEMWEPEDDIYVFDVGQNIAGWVELAVEGPTGTSITMGYGEHLHDDGTVQVDHGHLPERAQTDEYVLEGEGTETWESRFSYKGFRYVQVEGYPGEPDLDAITAKFVHTRIDRDNDSGFECSNDLLNQIHENTQWAYLNNHHSVPTDTPKYEKNGWTGDAQVTAEVGIYNYDMTRFYTKWLRDFRDSIRENGEVPTIVPTSGWSYEGVDPIWGPVIGPTPGWDVAYFLIPWWMYQYYGDERILEDHYEGMKQYYGWLQEYADEHIVRVGLGDWANPPEGPAITSTAYYFRMAEILSAIADLIGADDETATYAGLADDIREAFNDEFLDPEDSIYRTGETPEYRQTSNLFPLAFDMVPAEYEDAVVDNLVHDVMESHDGHLNTQTLGTKYLLPVLTEYGHHDVAYTVATQTDHPSWGHWIENGATSLLEFWPLDARSYNHHFLGVTDEWFYKHLAGIQVGEPGFEHVRIAPKPVGDLELASGKTETVRGLVESSWELVETPGDGQGIELEVTIPGNSTATIEIPTFGGDAVRVREGGKAIWNNGNRTRPNHPGIESIERTDQHVAVEVTSGEYDFELVQLGD